ncbi:MAG: hypothetical protein H7124_18755 [Phycisphaerales bacterium]|nr:hypothetical protein [Hyphomonadaceae bacterium]
MLRALVLSLGVFMIGVAHAIEPPEGDDNSPCAAVDHPYDGGRVFALPGRYDQAPDENELVAERCNVETMTLAVHNAGRLTNVYGGERNLAEGDEAAVAREEAIFNALIDQIRARADAQGSVRLLIYAHGGMVSHDNAVRDAEALAPFILKDDYTPLFLVWTSDPFSSYGNRLCCVMDGYEDTIWQGYFAPARVFGDVVSGIGRAPETYGKQLLRFGDSLAPGVWQQDYRVSNHDFRSDRGYFERVTNCDRDSNETSEQTAEEEDSWSGATVVLPPYCLNRLLNDANRAPGTRAIGYYANTPMRALTTWMQGVGAGAWDNMVRRTRTAFRASPGFAGIAQGVYEGSNCRDITHLGAVDAYRGAHRESESGAFQRFFTRLSCEMLVDPAFAAKVRVHFYGHSMGAIVGDELMRRFPELPYERIVYMGAADSIRDFSTGALPIVQARNVEFYNLSLHPMAETRELHYGGVPPAGSLLEWIDEMFESPRSRDDRVMGKWTNIRDSYQHFAPGAMRRMTFRVFPLQENTFNDPSFANECADMDNPSDTRQRLTRCHPLEHGEFNRYSFWRERYLVGHLHDEPLPPTPN